jgi:hypothetical protein
MTTGTGTVLPILPACCILNRVAWRRRSCDFSDETLARVVRPGCRGTQCWHCRGAEITSAVHTINPSQFTMFLIDWWYSALASLGE